MVELGITKVMSFRVSTQVKQVGDIDQFTNTCI